jgi:opacity protein-like surface antigen
MVGTGFEYALFGNWSAKIEYDYLDLGNKDVTLSGTVTTVTTGIGNPLTSHFDTTRNVKVDQTLHVVKIGVNYRFFGGY